MGRQGANHSDSRSYREDLQTPQTVLSQGCAGRERLLLRCLRINADERGKPIPSHRTQSEPIGRTTRDRPVFIAWCVQFAASAAPMHRLHQTGSRRPCSNTSSSPLPKAVHVSLVVEDWSRTSLPPDRSAPVSFKKSRAEGLRQLRCAAAKGVATLDVVEVGGKGVCPQGLAIGKQEVERAVGRYARGEFLER